VAADPGPHRRPGHHRCQRLRLTAGPSGSSTSTPTGSGCAPRSEDPAGRYHQPGHYQRIAARIYGGAARRDPGSLPLALADELAGRPSLRGYLGQIYAISGWTSLPWLRTLRQQTLVLAGDDDPIVPVANGRILARCIPHAQLHTVGMEVTCSCSTAPRRWPGPSLPSSAVITGFLSAGGSGNVTTVTNRLPCQSRASWMPGRISPVPGPVPGGRSPAGRPRIPDGRWPPAIRDAGAGTGQGWNVSVLTFPPDHLADHYPSGQLTRTAARCPRRPDRKLCQGAAGRGQRWGGVTSAKGARIQRPLGCYAQ